MAKNKLTDEQIDAIIKSRLEQFARKGGVNGARNTHWTEDELELMDNVIWDLITKRGYSREAASQKLKERWDVHITTARKYVKQAIERVSNAYEEDTDKLRKVFLERCEGIIKDAIENHQKDVAIKAMDLMAKSLGFYRESKDVNIQGDGSIKFDFS